jgi:hypothetical protein
LLPASSEAPPVHIIRSWLAADVLMLHRGRVLRGPALSDESSRLRFVPALVSERVSTRLGRRLLLRSNSFLLPPSHASMSDGCRI